MAILDSQPDLNKTMLLENKGGEFEMLWDGRDYTIPKGRFEVNNSALGRFIVETAKKWGKDIRVIDDDAAKEIKPEIEKKPESEIKTAPEPKSEKKVEKKKDANKKN